MKQTTKISYEEREYTPAEANRIAGVSADLQRDWRRRGLSPPRQGPGHSRFSFSEIVELTVKGFFARTGFSLKETAPLAGVAVSHVRQILLQNPQSYQFSGDTLTEAERRRAVFMRYPGGRPLEYMVVFHTLGQKEEFLPSRLCFDLKDLEDEMEKRGATGATILDLAMVARSIAEKGGLPFLTIQVTKNIRGEE